jgi:Ser/Thr protein kinase RdoA (MazF antagonist)
VTFWRFVPEHGALDERAAGRGLRVVHEALVDFPGELPELHTADTAALLDSVEPSAAVDLVRGIGARRPVGPAQVLHGDAHLFNCLPGPAGPLWHDFETACCGPRELDLAALVVDDRCGDGSPEARRALEAYGEHDAELLEELLPVYTAWIAASFMVALPRRPELEPRLARQLRWLRRYA